MENLLPSPIRLYKSQVMATGFKASNNSPETAIDKTLIMRIVYLEEALKQQFLNIETAAKLFQLYYTLHDLETLEPIPDSSARSFERELLTAKSKIIVELEENDVNDDEQKESRVGKSILLIS